MLTMEGPKAGRKVVMDGNPPESPFFSLDDLLDHVDMYGVDLFPPIDIAVESVRAQAFFSDVRDRWPQLYANVTIGNEFKINTTFQFSRGRQAGIDTFSLTARGPVFTFPRRMSLFQEEVDLRGAVPRQVFEQCLDLFLRTFPGRQALRLGVVRNLAFGSGQRDCAGWLGGRILQFGAAHLKGAQCSLLYQDGPHNIRLQMESIQLVQHTAVPATGQVVTSPGQFGLAVVFDVNNKDLHPLSPEERQEVLAKADELWPGRLIHFLNQRDFQ